MSPGAHWIALLGYLSGTRFDELSELHFLPFHFCSFCIFHLNTVIFPVAQARNTVRAITFPDPSPSLLWVTKFHHMFPLIKTSESVLWVYVSMPVAADLVEALSFSAGLGNSQLKSVLQTL